IQYFDDQLFNLYPITTLANEDGPSRINYSIHQNYPNPFNPITTLRYDLPENSLVNIIIYDMLGREVKTLINQTQDAGYRSVIWNATNDYGKPVSAGIYLYQIQAGEYMQTKKMVLLK
ncbi:MAG TPA: T9SS type A sorting domain-containing protein, partial [Candidatus Marinimicrobia bacterium]|nr:T9SS type A sorting domain-containing protein [Candidatus Neomarinimicrobiota bacterium]